MMKKNIEHEQMKINISQLKNIYAHLGDDLSKYIYSKRLMYSLTEDMRYIRDIVCTNKIGEDIYKIIKKQKEGGRSISIFGCGIIGRTLVDVYDDIKFDFFIDNNCYGKKYKEIEVISWENYLCKKIDGMIIISSKYYYQEIENQIISSGISKKQIINLGKEYSILGHMQYFDLPELENNRRSMEVFVDGGCYDAETSIDFINWCQKEGVKGYVFAYEIEKDNQKKCIDKLERSGIEYKMKPYGLWSGITKLRYFKDGKGSNICETGNEIVEVECIDSLRDKIPTFIKMDIEGAEYQALLGAKETIKQHKPKLAVCIYHKKEDMWELPQIILEMNPTYMFYLRHYSFAAGETVLYAVNR